MPKVIGLSAKEGTAVEYYCNPDSETYNNWSQSYKRAGYSVAKGWQNNGVKVLQRTRIKQAIADYRAKTGQVWEHDRLVAIEALNLNMLRLQGKADAGDVQAASAITACIRELNAISNLHSSTIALDQPEQLVLSEAERKDKEAFTMWELRQGLKVKREA